MMYVSLNDPQCERSEDLAHPFFARTSSAFLLLSCSARARLSVLLATPTDARAFLPACADLPGWSVPPALAPGAGL